MAAKKAAVAGGVDRPTVPDPSSPSSPSLTIVDRRGGSDDYGRVKLAGGTWISNYEYSALKKKAENKKLMASFDIPAAVNTIIGPAPLPPKHQQRARVPVSVSTAPSRVLPVRVSRSQQS